MKIFSPQNTFKSLCEWLFFTVPDVICYQRSALDWEEKKNTHLRFLQKKKRGLEKKLIANQELLKTAIESVPFFYELATLLQAYFHLVDPKQKQILLPSFEDEKKLITIALDPLKTTAQNVADYYKNSKKAKKSVPHLERLIALTKNNIEKVENELLKASTLKLFDKIPAEIDEAKKPEKAKISKNTTSFPYREFKSQDGFIIRVGKNAKDNDALTFTLSNGLDFWFHVANASGSHVTVKMAKNQKLSEQALQDAAQLALHYSALFEKKEGEVYFTQVKYLKRVKAKIGAVQMASPKKRWVKADPEILKRLFADNRQD